MNNTEDTHLAWDPDWILYSIMGMHNIDVGNDLRFYN